MKKQILGTCAAVAGVAMLLGGCAGTLSAYGGGPTTTRSRWEDPGFFGARVNERMSEVEQHVRSDIATGEIPAESINDLNARKTELQSALSQASVDGVIDRFEREQIRGIVRSAGDIGMMHTGPNPQNSYGYEGGYSPGSYYNQSWDWGM